MDTTTRKMKKQATAPPPTTPLELTLPQGPSPDSSRPLLPEAPDWFNRARVLANQRQTVGIRPVPLVRNCFAPLSGAASHWQIRNKTTALGLSLMAIPIVFLVGFWTRGVVEPSQHDSVSSGTGDQRVQVAAARHRKNKVSQHIASPPKTLPAVKIAPANVDGMTNANRLNSTEQPAEVARRRRPPKPSTIAANLDTGTQPFNQVVQIPVTEPASADKPDPVDGFALRSPVAGQFVANVQVPGNSWFSLAGATADCESGTCKLVPVKTADRKLNTALEWSSTPQQAAEQAAREGKLVFLIHVSGNFAQPGFT